MVVVVVVYPVGNERKGKVVKQFDWYFYYLGSGLFGIGPGVLGFRWIGYVGWIMFGV